MPGAPWEKYRTAPQGIPIGPQDPARDFKAPQAAAGVASTQANAQRTNQQISQDAALFDTRRQIAEAEAKLKEAQAAAAAREQQSKNPLNLGQLSAASTDAMEKLRTIDRIRQNNDNSWFGAIGFGSDTMRGIGGTKATDIAADIDSLKAGGALSEILKMTQETGKNPFTPMSNSDVEVIARNKGNLAQNQSDANFFANLNNYRNSYTRAYAGSEGLKALEAEIAKRLPNIPPEKREAFRADALRRYNEKMQDFDVNKYFTRRRRQQAKNKSAAGGQFLGFEE